MRTSVGQAAANSVAAWLTASLEPDITVLGRWPSSSKLPVNPQGRVKVVSVTKVGRRRRLDVNMPDATIASSKTGPVTARVTIPLGIYIQPLQLDVWCTYDVDRDDIIDQLDEELVQTHDPEREDFLVTVFKSEELGFYSDEFEEDDDDDEDDDR